MKKYILIVLSLVVSSMHAQMLTNHDHKQAVIESVDAQFNEMRTLSDQIWSFEEIAFQEFKSAKVLMDYAEQQGFKVTKNIGDIPTAFTAEYGSGSPVIGILGEFDALP